MSRELIYSFIFFMLFGLILCVLLSGCFLYEMPVDEGIEPGGIVGKAEIGFSVESGFYSSEQTVALTTSEERTTIYYTTNGDVVTLEAFTIEPYFIVDPFPPSPEPPAVPMPGSTNEPATEYTAPITIDSNTLIRAQAYRGDVPAGKEFSNMYFINENITFPVFSLVMDPRHLYDNELGIYVVGNNGVSPSDSYHPSQYYCDWERPVHIEFFEDVNNAFTFEMDAGMKMFGGGSRQFPMKSMAIFAREEYGGGSINYDFFDLTNNLGQPIIDYKSIILRNSGDDWYRTMFRDAFLQSITEGMDIDKQAYRPALVFLNGDYWGIQNIREKINEDYLAAHYDYVNPDEVDILAMWDSEIVEGDDSHFRMVLDFMENNDMAVEVNYNTVAGWVDISNFIDYTCTQLFINNTDWPFSNIKYWRPQSNDGKWRWLLYDTDPGFGGKEWDPDGRDFAYHNSLSFLLSSAADSDYRDFFLYIIENDTFRAAFLARFRELLTTNFLPSTLESQVDTMEAVVAPEIARHVEKWGSPATWAANVLIMRDYAQDRHDEWAAWLNFFEADFNALLHNGAFTWGGAFWKEGWASSNTTAAFTFDDDYTGDRINFTVNTLDATPGWSDIVVAYQDGISLSDGRDYELTFNAWVDTGTTSIGVALRKVDSPWTTYSEKDGGESYKIVSINTISGTVYTITCNMTGDDSNVRLMFVAGETVTAGSDEIHIDNIVLTDVTP